MHHISHPSIGVLGKFKQFFTFYLRCIFIVVVQIVAVRSPICQTAAAIAAVLTVAETVKLNEQELMKNSRLNATIVLTLSSYATARYDYVDNFLVNYNDLTVLN